ncbi:MAG: ABC transporter substrate-binding protein [Myxococcota bacterium]
MVNWPGGPLRGWYVAVLGMAWASGSAACTALVFDDAEQCANDGECARFGAGSTCGPDGVCVATGIVTGGTGGSGGIPAPRCSDSAECITALDSPTGRCIDGACVDLLSEDCQTITPETVSDVENTIFIGFMGPLSGDSASFGVPILSAVQLAASEIEEVASGVPVPGSTSRQTLVVVACDSQLDPLRTARHLAEDIQVPAIIGPVFSGITLEVIDEVTIPAGVVTISPSATSPALTTFQDQGLFWRTVPSDALQAIPIADQITALETIITATPEVNAGELKVANVRKGDAYGIGLTTELVDLVTFNGLSLNENSMNMDFESFEYDDPSANEVDYQPIVDGILRFEPNIISLLGTNETINNILVPVEAGWGSAVRPYYILPDGGQAEELLTAVDASPELASRIRGTAPVQEGPNFSSFAFSFETATGNAPSVFTSTAYDATTLIAFALVAGEGASPGFAVANGLTKLSDGTRIDAGPAQLSTGFAALADGGTIDFVGASGDLDFDPETGEAQSNIDVWCVDPNAGSARFLSTGLVYDATAGMMVGGFTCGN